MNYFLSRACRPVLIPLFFAGLTAAMSTAFAFEAGTFNNASAVGDAKGITTGTGGIRIVNCDQKVASRKRGVCINQMSAADFKALAPGVSWYYNWSSHPGDKPAGVDMEFIPMAWGNHADAVTGLRSYLASQPKKPHAILAINEPNLKGQAFITPEQTAKLYLAIKEVGNQFKIPVVGPNMAIGSPTNGSIKAVDPITKQETTYTFMVPFLKAIQAYIRNAPFEALGVHTYEGIGEVHWIVDSTHKDFNCPVWVTEYAWWKAPSVEEARQYLIEATDFMERSPAVAGYAWFKERAKDNPKISLLEAQPGKLTPLGEAYVNLPPHDDDLYYRIPGKLPAANYTAADRATIRSTIDEGGYFLMRADGGGSTLDYNIQVDKAGSYLLKFRVAGAGGKIELLKDGQLIATAITPDKKDWDTVQTTVLLSAGPQKLRVRYGTIGQCLHYIEFGQK